MTKCYENETKTLRLQHVFAQDLPLNCKQNVKSKIAKVLSNHVCVTKCHENETKMLRKLHIFVHQIYH